MGKSENYVLFGNYCRHSLEVGLNVQINELMKLNEYQSQCHYLTMAKGHSDFKIKSLFFSKTIESFGTKFHMEALGCMGMKNYTNE